MAEDIRLLEDVLAAASAFLEARTTYAQWLKKHQHSWTTDDIDVNNGMVATREAHLIWLEHAVAAARALLSKGASDGDA